MIVLFVLVTFLGSREPFFAHGLTSSPAVCAAKADELKAQASADPEVKGFIIECRPVPTKA